MSKSQKNVTPASNAEVRTWSAQNEAALVEAGVSVTFLHPPSGKVRGRIPEAARVLFTEKTGRPAAEKSDADKRMVTLPLVRKNAKGARLNRPEAFPVSEVRILAGAPAKGRLSSAHIAKAAEAVQEARGW